jgi:hypothetical protein
VHVSNANYKFMYAMRGHVLRWRGYEPPTYEYIYVLIKPEAYCTRTRRWRLRDIISFIYNTMYLFFVFHCNIFEWENDKYLAKWLGITRGNNNDNDARVAVICLRSVNLCFRPSPPAQMNAILLLLGTCLLYMYCYMIL